MPEGQAMWMPVGLVVWAAAAGQEVRVAPEEGIRDLLLQAVHRIQSPQVGIPLIMLKQSVPAAEEVTVLTVPAAAEEDMPEQTILQQELPVLM
jgi:hypothetical protein